MVDYLQKKFKPTDKLCFWFEGGAYVESSCEGDRVSVSVTDYGVAIVKHIVQLYGGTVNVSSDPGRKTVFAFELPAATKGNFHLPLYMAGCF